MIPKQRLCGESYESVAEPLMAAVDRSLDPSSEWHERREALYDVIRHVPLASFDKAAQQRLRALGVVPESDEATPGATASMPSSDEAEDDDPVAESEEATGESEEAVVDADRFVPVKKLSTRHRKAFRCKHCRFAWVERVSALAKRDQRTRRCLCVDSVLPHKYFCTRNAKVLAIGSTRVRAFLFPRP